MTGLRGVPYAMSQASYDLARLRGNGLIERIPRTNTYRLTADGLTFALVYSRVHDQVLYPLTAHDQPIAAPAAVRAAGGPSPGISTAPSPPPASGARPEPLSTPSPRPHRAARLGSTVKSAIRA